MRDLGDEVGKTLGVIYFFPIFYFCLNLLKCIYLQTLSWIISALLFLHRRFTHITIKLIYADELFPLSFYILEIENIIVAVNYLAHLFVYLFVSLIKTQI